MTDDDNRVRVTPVRPLGPAAYPAPQRSGSGETDALIEALNEQVRRNEAPDSGAYGVMEESTALLREAAAALRADPERPALACTCAFYAGSTDGCPVHDPALCTCDPDLCVEGGECPYCSTVDPEVPCPAKSGRAVSEPSDEMVERAAKGMMREFMVDDTDEDDYRRWARAALVAALAPPTPPTEESTP